MQRYGLRWELNPGPNNPTVVASIHTDGATKLLISFRLFSIIKKQQIENSKKIHLTSILCQLGLSDDPIQLIHNS
jgi:hypothetical protein